MLCPCSPRKLMVEQGSICSPWRRPSQSSYMSKEAVSPWETCTGTGSWQHLWSHEERSSCCCRCAGRACQPVDQSALKDFTMWIVTHTGAVNVELQPVGPTLEKFMEVHKSCCGRDPTAEEGKSVRSNLPCRGRNSRDKCDELQFPFPIPLHHWRGKGRDN